MSFASRALRVSLLSLPLVLTLAVPALAASESSAKPDTAVYTLPLGTVVDASRTNVELRRNPAATTVLSGDAIARSARGLGVGDVLVSVPGLRMDAPADAARVHMSIRGQGILTESGVRGIKLLLDGIPLNDPSGTAMDAYDIDWATVSRVEVLRGPSAALYGGGGSAGVINVTTADGGPGAFGSHVEFTGGSYGFNRTTAEAGGTAGTTSWRTSFSRAGGDGWRNHNAFYGDNAYGKLHWHAGDRVELQQVLAWTDYNEENAEGLNAAQVVEDPRQANPDATPFDERFKTGRFTAGTTARLAIDEHQDVRLAGWMRVTRYAEPRPREYVRQQLLSPGASAQYDLELRSGAMTHRLSAGADVSFQGANVTRWYNPGAGTMDSLLANADIRQRGVGAFALDNIQIAPAWSAMLCARWDDVDNRLDDHAYKGNASLSGDRRFQRATFRGGLAWTARPALNLYGSFGQGFLPPATEQLVNNPAGYAGFNQELTFATSNGGELGARGVLSHGVSYEMCGFLLDTDNDFDRYRLSERPGLTFYRNSGTSQRYGAETRLTWAPCRYVELDGAYTWSHFRYTKPAAIDGNSLPNSPEHQFVFDAEVTPVSDLTLGVNANMQSDWQLDPQNSATVPGFALWGASLTWRWHASGLHGDLSVSGRNLLGANYMAFTEPDPDGNSYQPGPPAEYYARVRLFH